MVRDLVSEAVRMEEKDQFDHVRAQAAKEANKTIVRLLVPGIKKEKRRNQMQELQDMMSMLMPNDQNANNIPEADQEEVTDEIRNERLSVAEQLDKGLLEDRDVTIEVEQAPKINPMGNMMNQMGVDMGSMLNEMMPKKRIKRTMSVRDAREVLIQEESKKLVDYDSIYQKAIGLFLSMKLTK